MSTNLVCKRISSATQITSTRRFLTAKLAFTLKRNITMTTATPPVKAPSFQITAEEINSRAAKIINDSKAIDDEIANEKQPNFANVFKKYALKENERMSENNILSFFQQVSSDKDLRDASSKAEELMSNYEVDAGMREDVYKVVKQAFDNLSSEKANLDAEDLLLAEKLEKKFRRNGLGLDKETREKVGELRKELTNVCIKFQKQLGEENGSLLFSQEDLEGLSESALEQYKKNDKGEYIVTFKYPDYLPLMKYAKKEKTRKTAYVGYENRAEFNKDLVVEAVKLRAEIAKLLGYENHSAYVLEERMAKDPKTVDAFLNDLLVKSKDMGKKDVQVLLDLKKEIAQPEDDVSGVFPWDVSYLNNLYIEREFQVDEEKISQYFPLDQTIDGMLSIFSQLFSLKFVHQEAEKGDSWHDDVRLLSVWRTDKEEFVGYLYFDMHPRDNKYGHAANFSLIKRCYGNDGKEVIPSTAIVCNFSKPTDTKPSLLKHSEVVTFFHELGHGIHCLTGKAKYARFAGTNVDWDFVEAPSQMLEYWTWNKAQLKDLSHHYKDGSKLDDALIDSLIRTKHVNAAYAMLRQLYFAIFDFRLHTSTDGNVDIAELWNTMKPDVTGVSNGGTFTHGYSSFGHIMGGYDSGYYGYKWSEVFAADMYHTKFSANPLDSTAGAEYRDKVIGRGGSRDQWESLKDFLGREPNNIAFLKEMGITA